MIAFLRNSREQMMLLVPKVLFFMVIHAKWLYLYQVITGDIRSGNKQVVPGKPWQTCDQGDQAQA